MKKTNWAKYNNILQQKDEHIKEVQIDEENWKRDYEEIINE